MVMSSEGSDYASLIAAARRDLDRDLAMRSVVEQQIERAQAELSAQKDAVEVLDKTAMLLNTLGEERQQEAQTMIEGLVTRGLQAIFEPNLSLVIREGEVHEHRVPHPD